MTKTHGALIAHKIIGKILRKSLGSRRNKVFAYGLELASIDACPQNLAGHVDEPDLEMGVLLRVFRFLDDGKNDVGDAHELGRLIAQQVLSRSLHLNQNHLIRLP